MKENDIIDNRYRLLEYQGSDGERFGEIWLVQDTRIPNSEPEYMVVSDRVFAGEYLLIRQLGNGGFGEVWKAKEIDSGVNVALKIHKDGDSVQATNQIVKEYTRVTGIHHDNLVTPTHVKIVGGKTAYLKMELCRRDIVGIELDEPEIWRLIRDVSSGLKRLAENQRWSEQRQCLVDDPIIHQDIKPENILLRSNGKYAISDFGISKRRLSSLTTTEADNDENPESWMTVAYAAPERFPRGVGHSELSSDIWSLGAMLYEIAERQIPFAECGGDCLNPQIGLKIPAITRDGYSIELKQLVYDCMAKEPNQRPTASQLVEYSGKVLKGEPRKVEWAGANKDIKYDKTKRARKFKRYPWKQKPFPPKKEEKKKYPKREREKRENVFLKNAVLWISLRKKALGYISFVCVILGLGYFFIPKIWSVLDSPERKAWRAAKEENTFAAYASFIDNYSNSKYINEALYEIVRIDDAENNIDGLRYVILCGDSILPEISSRSENMDTPSMEAQDSIRSLCTRWSIFAKNLQQRVKQYTFDRDYSLDTEQVHLRKIVSDALTVDSIWTVIDQKCTVISSEGESYFVLEINGLFEDLYNTSKLCQENFNSGLNSLSDGEYYAPEEYKENYNRMIEVLNLFFEKGKHSNLS